MHKFVTTFLQDVEESTSTQEEPSNPLDTQVPIRQNPFAITLLVDHMDPLLLFISRCLTLGRTKDAQTTLYWLGYKRPININK
jgi:hypothetical protein